MNLAPTNPPATPHWTDGPPTPMHLEQIAVAKQRGKKIRRVIVAATISAWSTAIFAGLTMLCAFTSPLVLLLGAGMCLVAFVEFRGLRELKRLDRDAPRRMALNQIVFGIMLFLYGGANLWSGLKHPQSPELESAIASNPEVARMLPTTNLEAAINVAVYGTVMLVAIIGPGLTALYYRSVIKHIDAYVKDSPQWILDLQRAGMSL